MDIHGVCLIDILGNGYLLYFFTIKKDEEVYNKILNCYSLAVKLLGKVYVISFS